jgi:carboxymethylenebutenolidase
MNATPLSTRLLAIAVILGSLPLATLAAQTLPPDAEHALDALNASPRHAEWAMVRLPDGDSVRAWVVYPERSGPAPVVVVIHEIYGLTHWIRGVADQLAAEGFIAVAPDLLTMHGVPTDAAGEPDRQAATAAIRTLDPDGVQRQLRAVAEHGMALPAAQRAYAITGFCWGGAATFEHASRYQESLLGGLVYYGSSPDEAALARVRVPVVGFYGGDDERVNATIPRARAALGDGYRALLYDGAGHGFLRQQTGRDGANLRASQQAWAFTIGYLTGAEPRLRER